MLCNINIYAYILITCYITDYSPIMRDSCMSNKRLQMHHYIIKSPLY